MFVQYIFSIAGVFAVAHNHAYHKVKSLICVVFAAFWKVKPVLIVTTIAASCCVFLYSCFLGKLFRISLKLAYCSLGYFVSKKKRSEPKTTKAKEAKKLRGRESKSHKNQKSHKNHKSQEARLKNKQKNAKKVTPPQKCRTRQNTKWLDMVGYLQLVLNKYHLSNHQEVPSQ